MQSHLSRAINVARNVLGSLQITGAFHCGSMYIYCVGGEVNNDLKRWKVQVI